MHARGQGLLAAHGQGAERARHGVRVYPAAEAKGKVRFRCCRGSTTAKTAAAARVFGSVNSASESLDL